MSQYATQEETASVFRKATPDELWLYAQLDSINPNRHEMGSVGDTQALIILALTQRDMIASLKKLVEQWANCSPVVQFLPADDTEGGLL